MSLVSRPWRYDARSVPETTIRPRSRTIDERRAMAGRVVRRGRNVRNHGVMLRHALAPFYPCGARGGAARPAARRGRTAAGGTGAAAGSGRHQLLDLPARQRRSGPNRSRSPASPAAGPSSAPDVWARRSTRSRGGCRCATPPTGNRSTSRWTAPFADRRRRFTRRSTARPRRATSPCGRTAGAEDRHDRSERAAAVADQLLRPVRGGRRAVEDGRRRQRDSGLHRAAGVDSHRRRRVLCRADSDDRAPRQRAAHPHRARAACRTPRRRSLDRRHRPHDPLQRAAAVARGRPRGHRGGVVAQRHHLEAERSAGEHPEQRLLARRHLVEAGAVDARRGCRPSCSSAAAAPPIATASSPAFRFSGRSPTRSPTPATSSSATTSGASVRAAGARKPRRSTDYADDVRAAVKLLADRKDVDPKRIAVDRPQRRRSRGADGGRERQEDCRRRPDRHAGHDLRRRRARAAEARAGSPDADTRGTAGQGRRAEEDP